MIGWALIALGAAAAVAGVRVALERPRPASLAGALLAPAGLALALLGVGRVLWPGFLGGAPAPALRIMPAGDSITQGSYGAGLNGDGGYRAPLWQRLARAGRAVDFVGSARSGPLAVDRDHDGFNGITAGGLARHLARDLPAHRPDVVLLHIGTNDIIQGASPETATGRVADVIDLILERAPRAILLVASPIGVRVPNDYRVTPEAMAALAAGVRRVALDRAARTGRVHFVDMATRAVRAPGDFHADGLHPNPRGYEQIANVWFDALTSLAGVRWR